VEAQLFEDVSPVGLDGEDAQEEPGGDLFVALPSAMS
jgi:hypothetical protein